MHMDTRAGFSHTCIYIVLVYIHSLMQILTVFSVVPHIHVQYTHSHAVLPSQPQSEDCAFVLILLTRNMKPPSPLAKFSGGHEI